MPHWRFRDDLILLAWLTFKGAGEAADIKQANWYFSRRGSTTLIYKPVPITLGGKSCGDLTTESWTKTDGMHTGGFSIQYRRPSANLESKEAKAQAAASCQRLADAGDANAMAWMGATYNDCIPECSGEKRDHWWMRAAEAGNQYAAYALVAYVTKRTLAAAQQAVEKYSPQWDADTRFAARYNLALASDAPASELDDIMRQLKQRPDLWKNNWAQAMLRHLVEEKKVKELEPGDALRAYATQKQLIDANGQVQPQGNLTNQRHYHWFSHVPWDFDEPLRALNDEAYYAMQVTGCRAWTRGNDLSSLGCNRIPYALKARPPTLAMQSDSAPITVGDFVLQLSGTVQQKSKRLEWMPCSLGETWDAQRHNCQGTALKHSPAELATAVQQANAGKGQYGHTDWRLPTLLELHGLIQCRYGTQPKGEKLANGMVLARCKKDPLYRNDIPPDLFPNLNDSHWTSTAVGKKRAWFTFSPTGWITDWQDNSHKNPALLVRNLP